MSTDDLLLVGIIARPHGIKGNVIVNPQTDFVDERFKVGNLLLVGPAGLTEPKRIRESRIQQGRPVIAFDGIESMDDAEALAGLELWMPAAELGELPGNTYYRHDLIGCDVRDTHDAVVGRVSGVEGTLERSYLVVARKGGEVMIPMVDGILLGVDIAARRIVVNPPDGLLDL